MGRRRTGSAHGGDTPSVVQGSSSGSDSLRTRRSLGTLTASSAKDHSMRSPVQAAIRCRGPQGSRRRRQRRSRSGGGRSPLLGVFPNRPIPRLVPLPGDPGSAQSHPCHSGPSSLYIEPKRPGGPSELPSRSAASAAGPGQRSLSCLACLAGRRFPVRSAASSASAGVAD